MLLPAATKIGLVALVVAELERSLDFYGNLLGLAVLDRRPGVVVLGVTDEPPLLVLYEDAAAQPKPRTSTGLYHVAILYPSRADLGRVTARVIAANWFIREFEDHLVSESVYLSDPDGNGVELYRDRSREEWPLVDGKVTMGSEQIDVPQLLADGESDGRTWTGAPAGTRIGHVHLQVADIPTAQAFYVDLLGFELMVAYPQALFVAAGGYHHHLGLNAWFSANGPSPAPDDAGLRGLTIHLPDEASRTALVERLAAHGVGVEVRGPALALADPWGSPLLLTVGAPLDVAAALAATA